MRFFHLSDLHLGIKLYEHDLLKDQKAILDEIVALTRQYQPDAVVFAGDIYDRSVPPVEAVALFDDFMTQLRAALPNGEIMLISGNHDSAQRLDVFRSELSDRGIHMIGNPPMQKGETIERVTLTDDFGAVNFYLLPFVRPGMVRNVVDTKENGDNLSYPEAFSRLLALSPLNPDEEAEKKLVENATNIRENVPMATAADVEAMLQAWLPELQSASKSVQAKVKALDDVRKNLDGAKAERDKLEKAASDAQETAKSTAVKKAEAEKTWNLHQEELSGGAYRTREDAVAQRTQAQEAKQKAETAASQAAEKERQAQKAETDCETQIRRLNEEMPQKQANAEEFNQQYQQTMAEKSLDEAQWKSLTETYPDVKIADRLQEETEAFKEKKTAEEAKREAAQNAIAGKEKPNMEQLNAASAAAESALKEVSNALEAAKHLHSDNAKVLKDLREGRDPLAKACKAANTAQHLSDVMAGTESGNRMNLETFVQRSYMEKILCDANRRFRDMSNGQFELKLTNVEDAGEGRNKGLDLEVYSIVTGKTRSVNTLSGGESFMAALSLALGMADQIQAATAAIHLDVMFIDEGFGSLSDNARNEAVNILKEMAGKQRQIGIISHVSELKDEIENQLIVKKDDRGSHISWR